MVNEQNINIVFGILVPILFVGIGVIPFVIFLVHASAKFLRCPTCKGAFPKIVTYKETGRVQGRSRTRKKSYLAVKVLMDYTLKCKKCGRTYTIKHYILEPCSREEWESLPPER